MVYLLWIILIVSCCLNSSPIIGVNGAIDLSSVDVNNFESLLPNNVPKMNISVDQAKDLIKQKCLNTLGDNNGDEAYQNIEIGAMTLVECVTNILNYTAIQEEITEASPKGELDVVFNKYCAKQPDLVQCIDQFSSKISPCLDKDEQDSQAVIIRMTHKVLDFICNKGGDHIALFIAEKGPECLQSQKDGIQNCLNTTFSSYIPAENLDNIKSLPKLVLSHEQCDDIHNVETCIVRKLEKCDEITPANIIESLFRFMRNETICRDKRSGGTLYLTASKADLVAVCNPSTIVFISLFMQFFYAAFLSK